jgi:Zn-finger nucleic acid-binding protein
MGLAAVRYRGLRMDTCPGCRGIWIDREWLNRVVDGRPRTAVLRLLLQYLTTEASRDARSEENETELADER